MTFEELLRLDPKELTKWLDYEFPCLITAPSDLTYDFLRENGKKLMILSSRYSYLLSLSSYAKIAARSLHRKGSKAEYEDMVDRKESILNKLEAVKMEYNSLSRSMTAYQMLQKENEMTDFR